MKFFDLKLKSNYSKIKVYYEIIIIIKSLKRIKNVYLSHKTLFFWYNQTI